jgi:hypothetical protein
MGYSLSWLAFRGVSPEAAMQRLHLTDTGQTVEYASAPVAGQALPDGWHLVVATRCDHPLVSPEALRLLSEGSEVVACSIEEHVMFSSAERWTDGRRAWRIEHASERSRRDIDVEGLAPESLQAALDRASKQQDAEDSSAAEVDYFFEVPLDVARSIAGFKHDEGVGSSGDRFIEYSFRPRAEAAGRHKKWWQFWR